MLKPLAFAHPLEDQEPARGFASRLAALNGRTLVQFMADMGIEFRSLTLSLEPTIRDIAFLGRADPEKLLACTPRQVAAGRFEVAGETFERHRMLRTYFRYCPRCLLEDLDRYDGPVASRPWLRMDWTIAHFRSCVRHGVNLVTAPRRNPNRPDFNRTMRAVVAGLHRTADAAVETRASPFQAWLHSRLRGVRDAGNWLDDLPMHVAAPFCEALGVSSLHDPKTKSRQLTEPEWFAAADEGFRYASAGEDAIRALLGRLNNAHALTRGIWGLGDTYGYVYSWLQRTVDDPGYGKLREVVRRFALESVPVRPGTNVLGEIVANRNMHTVYTATRFSGLQGQTVRRLLEGMGVKEAAERSGRTNNRVVVKSEEIQRLVSDLKGSIGGVEIEKLLGLPPRHLSMLVADGHFPALAGTGVGTKTVRRFERDAVEEFRTRLFQGTIEVAEPTARQLNIVNVRRVSRTSLSNILDMVLTGKLSWKGRLAGRSDYLALLLDADEVTRLVHPDESRTNLIREEAQAFLGITYDRTVNLLIAAGHLKVVKEFSPDARRLIRAISRDSAESFRSRFVALGELCQRAGIFPKQVRAHLQLAGILPVMLPQTVGAYFYDRKVIDTYEAENVDPWAYNPEAIKKALKERNAQIRKGIAA